MALSSRDQQDQILAEEAKSRKSEWEAEAANRADAEAVEKARQGLKRYREKVGELPAGFSVSFTDADALKLLEIRETRG